MKKKGFGGGNTITGLNFEKGKICYPFLVKLRDIL